MRLPLYICLLTLSLLPRLVAQSSSVGPLPDERKAIPVTEGERNPFGKKITKITAEMPADTESEESRIRSHVAQVGVYGFRSAPEGNKALLGSYLITEGLSVPPFFANQTETLRVNKISEKEVELGFVEQDGTHASRLISLSFDLRPTVRYKLTPTGQTTDPAVSSEYGGVIKKQ